MPAPHRLLLARSVPRRPLPTAMPDDIRAKFLSIPQLVAVVNAARRDPETLASGLASLIAETPAICELVGMHKEEFATLLNSTDPLPEVATATEADKMDTSDDGALATLANLSSTADPLPPEKEAAMATADEPETETARTVPTPPDRAPDCPVCLGERSAATAAHRANPSSEPSRNPLLQASSAAMRRRRPSRSGAATPSTSPAGCPWS